MFIIDLFSDINLILKFLWSLIKKNCGNVCHYAHFLTLCNHVFHLWFHVWNLLYVRSRQKQVTDVSLILKDSDMESENLSLLIPLSVSDGQKTDISKDVSFMGL